MKGVASASNNSTSSPLKTDRFAFLRREKGEVANVESVVADAALSSSSKLRVSITVHDCVGVRLSQIGLLKNSKLYWTVRLLSASGHSNQKVSTLHVPFSEAINDRFIFEETFGFNLEFEGQVMELKLKEVDTALSYTLSERCIGRMYWQVYSDRLRQNPVNFQKFALRHPTDMTRVVDGCVSLSASVSSSDEEESFWRMFKREDADLQKRAEVAGFTEDQSQVAVVLQHVRPLLEAYWVLLYTILRPIYWTVVEVRSVLTDWHDPGLTILAQVGAFWMWWSENVLFGIFVVIFVKLARLAGLKKTATSAAVLDKATVDKKLTPKEMLLEYGEARKALYYGRIDPLSYKLLSVEARLKKIGRSLLTLESDFLNGEPNTCKKVLGSVVAIALSIKFLPLFEIVSVALRTLFLFVLLQMSVLVPIRRRLPLLFPGISAQIKTLFQSFAVRFILPIRSFFGKRLLGIKAVSKLAEDDASWAGQISADDWMGLCKDWGKKVFFGKGERVGSFGDVGKCMYRLVSGEVVVKGGDNGVDVTVVAPATLLQTNCFIGHGRQSQEIIASKSTVAYELRVRDVRFFLVANPNFAKSFWASMAVKTAVDLRYWVLTLVGGTISEELMSAEGYDPNVMQAPLIRQEWKIDPKEKDAILKLLAKEHSITEEEMEVFSGVMVRLPVPQIGHGRGMERFVEGIFVCAQTLCLFHAIERRHFKCDFKFQLSQVETAKVTPARKFGLDHNYFRLKIKVATGDFAATRFEIGVGGAFAASRLKDFGAAKKNDPEYSKLVIFSHDGLTVKRIMRNMMGRIKFLNLTQMTEVSNEFFGPSLLSVEMTSGVEHMERSNLANFKIAMSSPEQASSWDDVLGGTQEVATQNPSLLHDECVGFREIVKRRSEVFSQEDKLAIEKLSYQLDRMYKAGAVMLKEGEFYDSVILLMDGTISLRISNVEFARMSASAKDHSSVRVVGSYSFIMRESLDFSVVAITSVTLRVLDRKTMDTLMEREPSFGSRFYEMIVYDLADKVTRVWLALLSKSDWEDGIQLIRRQVELVEADEKVPKKIDPRQMSKLVAAYLSTNDLRRS